MYSAYKLNKQGDNIQPWCTPFPIWNQSVVPCPVLTVASWPAYRFSQEADQMVWYSHLFQNFPQFLWSTQSKALAVNKAEIDVFMELSCFFHDPADVGNLISGSSAFSKTTLNIRKFTVHVLLKPGLENFEHCFTSLWDECNCVVVCSILGTHLTWGVYLSESYLFAFSYCSWGSQGKNTEVVCHSLLQWTTFCQTSPPWPGHLGWPHMAWLSFIDLDKAVVHVIRLVSCLWLWFQSVGPLSVPTILLGFLLPWMWGVSSGLLQQSAAAAPYLGQEVSPYHHPSWPWMWSSSSGPPAPAQLPLLGHGVAPLIWVKFTQFQFILVCWFLKCWRSLLPSPVFDLLGLTTSSLPWFIYLTFQVPMRHCSL